MRREADASCLLISRHYRKSEVERMMPRVPMCEERTRRPNNAAPNERSGLSKWSAGWIAGGFVPFLRSRKMMLRLQIEWRVRSPGPKRGFLPLGPWVGGHVGGLEALDGDMGVDLGRGEAGVAEQGLHAAEVGAII